MAGNAGPACWPGMRTLTCDRASWLADGKPIVLRCGEIHYWRVARADWADRLAKLRACGADAVATYVPWLVHEPEEGRYDFATHDVEAFLRACADAGLWAIVRPGPYQYSELVHDGLPHWLVAQAELLARRPDGTAIRGSSISYAHPRFLALAKRWYDAVLPRIVRHQVSRGGAVAALQVDNELIGIHDWFGSLDHHPETYGIGAAAGRWPDAVARRGGLAAANAAYGTAAQDPAAIRPRDRGGEDDASRRLARDWQECYLQSVADYAALLQRWMREAGADVPIVHNAANADMVPLFERTVAACGQGFVLGADHYYNLDQDWGQNNPTPQYARRCAYSLDLLRSWGMPPTVWEMPGGSASEWPPITAQDLSAAWMVNAAYGMKGVSYYIFAGGANAPGTGANGDDYDYGAPVARDGSLRPSYDAMRSFHAIFDHEPWLAAAERSIDCRIVLDPAQMRAARWAEPRGAHAVTPGEAWDTALKGVFTAASCAGWSPEFIDALAAPLPTDLPLVVPSSASMPRALQERLAAALASGARLLVLPMLPTHDEDWRPCRILADALAAPAQRRLDIAMPRIDAFGVANVFANGALVGSDGIPAGASEAARDARSGAVVAWCARPPGGGTAVWWGQAWKHSKREHAAAIDAALRTLGGRPVLQVEGGDVWAVLRSDGGSWLLFLCNLFSAPRRARVRFTAPDGGEQDTGDLEIPAMTVRTWPR